MLCHVQICDDLCWITQLLEKLQSGHRQSILGAEQKGTAGSRESWRQNSTGPAGCSHLCITTLRIGGHCQHCGITGPMVSRAMSGLGLSLQFLRPSGIRPAVPGAGDIAGVQGQGPREQEIWAAHKQISFSSRVNAS